MTEPASGRRPQLTRKPAKCAGTHGVIRYRGGAGMTAFLALERATAEAGCTLLEFRQQHPMLPALRAAGPLERGNDH